MNIQLRYSLFLFTWFFSLAIIWAFVPIYLAGIGLTNGEVGYLSILISAATLIASPAVTQAISLFVAPRVVVLPLAILALIFVIPLITFDTLTTFSLYWMAFLFFNSALMGCVESCAVASAEVGRLNFESARLWGSLGFVSSIFTVGYVIDCRGESIIMTLATVTIFVNVISAFYIRSILPNVPTVVAHKRESGRIRRDFSLWPLASLLLVVALVWASHSAFYVYFSLYVKALGWSASETAFAWNLGVLAECLVFTRFVVLRKYASLQTLIIISAGLTALRWIICYLSADKLVLMSAQLLHAFSFCALYLSSVHLAQKLVPRTYAERAQGILSGVGTGAGSVGGRLIFALLASQISNESELNSLFVTASLIAALAFICALFSARWWRTSSSN